MKKRLATDKFKQNKYFVSINLSPEHKAEAIKILAYIEKMEAIVRTTPNAEQKTRVKKELFRYHKKLANISPLLDLAKSSAKNLRNELSADGGGSLEGTQQTKGEETEGSFRVLDKIKLELASPNCQDNDINFLSTVFGVIHLEYWPALTDRHTKLDFSHGQERDGIRLEIDNVLRNLEVLVETIEEYAKAEKQDFREQLLKMKNRQTRTFIYDANEALKKCREFLKKLSDDVNGQGGIVMNKEDKIHFNTQFEKSTMLEGHTVREFVLEFSALAVESIKQLNLPELKIKT